MRWFLKLDTSLVNGIDRKERLEYIFHVKQTLLEINMYLVEMKRHSTENYLLEVTSYLSEKKLTKEHFSGYSFASDRRMLCF